MKPVSVVLVTGAARRLGRAIALHLAGSGAHIAVHYRHSETDATQLVDELAALGVEAKAFQADLSIEAECMALVPAVIAHFGQLHAIVNNASLFEHDDIHSFCFANMEAHCRANTAPAIVLARALHRHAVASGGRGCVVNLLDQKLWNLNPDHLSYTLSKAALETSTKMLALALAPHLRVCGVAPGVTLPSGPMTAQDFAHAAQMTPLGRSSTAEDVACAVQYLINSPAVTGSSLLVDGGQHLSAQPRDVMFLVPPSP